MQWVVIIIIVIIIATQSLPSILAGVLDRGTTSVDGISHIEDDLN